MMERPGLVKSGQTPLTLLGPAPALSRPAPDFHVLDKQMTPVGLADFAGQVLILLSVPSLDTPVCDIEAQRFNAEASALAQDVHVATVSMDLPFALKRYCAAHGIERIHTLSDHREASFGLAYGVLIKQTRLLARAVFVLDRQAVLRYYDLMPDLGDEPDYDAVLEAARALV